MSQVPKNRTDLIPHYSRFIATLNKYMPDIGTEVVSLVNMLPSLLGPSNLLNFLFDQLDEDFRYLQRKKNVVKELAEVRLKACKIFYNSILELISMLEHHFPLKPHQIRCSSPSYHSTHVQSLLG